MIGIVNIQWIDNPGAVWLAYSLQQTVKSICPNDEVRIIDYAVGAGPKYSFFQRAYNKAKRILRKIYYFRSINASRYEELLRQRHALYEQYRDEYLVRTNRFVSIFAPELLAEYSHCITGSDVVWKPEIADSEQSAVYFLGFASKKISKIAYAASIGTDDIAVLKPYAAIYSRLLKDFDYISMRESSSAVFIHQLTQKDVYQAADPVFLLDEDQYNTILKNSPPIYEGKYIFLYLLSYYKGAVDFAVEIAEKFNLKIVYDMYKMENFWLQKYLKNIGVPVIAMGPIEFLTCIKNAEYIVTNSFHGLAFSILFHKEFYVFGRKNHGVDISVRMKELLSILHLENRYNATNLFPSSAIDYKQVTIILKKMREESIGFLRKALYAEGHE